MNFEFLDGPPFINGKMHHGHALVSSIKDTILRHKETKVIRLILILVLMNMVYH